jgi:hypothetical protein
VTSKPVRDHPVEVERGHRPGHAHRRGGLVLGDGAAAADDEPVQGPPLRLGQRRHTGDACLEVVGHAVDISGSTIPRWCSANVDCH